MSDTDSVLAAIDACLDDMGVSEDAMRWASDEPDPTLEPSDAESVVWHPVIEGGQSYRAPMPMPVYQYTPWPLRGATPSVTIVDEVTAGWPIIRDESAGELVWDSVISPARAAFVAASDPADLLTDLLAARDLLRISMPDSSESFHRVLSVTPGESLGEYWLTIEPAVTVFTEAADRLRRAAETALEGFGKAFGPVLSATQAALHRGTYEGDRKHFRRCPTCNPAGFPKGMSIDRAEYHRRQRSRSRR